MKYIYSTFIAFIILLSGCSPKVYEPVTTTIPTIETKPDFKTLASRTPPEPSIETIEIIIQDQSLPQKDDYVNNPGALLKENGSSPSVIISIPEEIAHAQNTIKFDDEELTEVFKPSSYSEDVQYAIESALLRQGFNVLDRSQFEAKIRDIRKSKNTQYWWTNYENLLENENYDAVKTLLEEKLKSGKLAQDDYIKRIAEVDEISIIGLAKKKRKEYEKTDISDVINAAQTGIDKADYVLQINDISIINAGNKFIDLQNKNEIKDLLNRNPGLKLGNGKNCVPMKVKSQWLQAEFNAKLIDVNTGSIVWLGYHELESWAAEPIRIVFEVQKKVINADQVNLAINNYNDNLNTTASDLSSSANALLDTYRESIVPHKFKKNDELFKYTQELTSKLETLETDYNNKKVDFDSALKNIPSVVNNDWEYEYVVSDVNIVPNLLVESDDNINREFRLLRHRKQLIKKVTQELLETIKVVDNSIM